MIARSLFGEDNEMWRATVRRFVEEEIVPHHAQWEHDGIVPRSLWLKAGERGLLCCAVPQEYGGLGLDYLFDVVVVEELWRVGASGPGFLIHTDLVATYIHSFGTEEQKRHWLPKMSGSARILPRPQSRKSRHEGAGHLGTILRGRTDSRHKYARPGRPRLRADDDQAAARASGAGDPLRDGDGNRDWLDGRLHRAAHGVRSNHRGLSEHPVRARRPEGARGDGAGGSPANASTCSARASSTPRTRRW